MSTRDATARRRVLESLRLPAGFLVGVGAVGLFVIAFSVLMIMAVSADDEHAQAGRVRAMVVLVSLPFAFLSGLSVAGGVAAWRGRNYTLARAGAIAGILALHTTFLGISVGIWTLVMLNRAGVAEAFGNPLPGHRDVGTAPQPADPSPAPVPVPAEIVGPQVPTDPLARVRTPGAFMVAAGVLAVLGWTLAAIAPSHPARADGEALGRFMAVTEVLIGAVVLAAGVSLLQGRRYALAVLGAALCCATCVCLVPGIPLGIWSLVQLCRADVQAAFRRQA